MEVMEKASRTLRAKLGLGDEWTVERYVDGSQILTTVGYEITIERVCMPRSKMPRWCVCSRSNADFAPDDLSYRYPPILSGPFPNLASAIAAYKVLVST